MFLKITLIITSMTNKEYVLKIEGNRFKYLFAVIVKIYDCTPFKGMQYSEMQHKVLPYISCLKEIHFEQECELFV